MIIFNFVSPIFLKGSLNYLIHLLFGSIFRYKESITKSTRGWKERFFSRNASTQDMGSEVRGEGGPGVAALSHVMDRPESRENTRTEIASVPNNQENSVIQVENDQSPAENSGNHSLSEVSMQAPCPASSGPN